MTDIGAPLQALLKAKRYADFIEHVGRSLPEEDRRAVMDGLHHIARLAGRGPSRNAKEFAAKVELALETELVRAQHPKRHLRGQRRRDHTKEMQAKYVGRLKPNVIDNVIAQSYDKYVREEMERRLQELQRTDS
jgi:hypothetical protein